MDINTKVIMDRVARMNMAYTKEYIKELSNCEKEQEEVKKAMNVENSVVVLTADWNSKVCLDCMKECVKIHDYLIAHGEDVEEWILAGINGMINKVNEDNEIPFDLPYVIYKMLTYAEEV